MPINVVVIGGGAAGFFGAITLAEVNPDVQITILEQSQKVLDKVRISGGGRCNVTNALEDPSGLIHYYPRGQKELLGPFHRFGPGQMKAWLEAHGVTLKTEEDGRVFPESDRSETIIECFMRCCRDLRIGIHTSRKVVRIVPPSGDREPFTILTRHESYSADAVLIATGGQGSIWRMLADLGHTIVPPVPSLFTFQISDQRIMDLPGVQVPRALVSLPDFGLEAEGPLLITHWGMSGPAILKLSSWGARDMAERNYRVPLLVNWNPAWSMEDLRQLARTETKRQVKNTMQLPVPRRLWMGLLKDFSGLQKNWSDVSDKELSDLYQRITKTRWPVHGKSTFKEEFVTAGGVELKEIDFKSFQSRRIPRLYLAGEVLNIDALTGGFNFQAAWTGSYIAGQAMAALGIDMD